MDIYIEKFDDDTFKYVKQKIHDIKNIKEPISILINSNGGYFHSLLDMITLFIKNKIIFDTICLEKAYSCGAILFSRGRNRVMVSGSRLMFHALKPSYFTNKEGKKVLELPISERLKKLYILLHQKIKRYSGIDMTCLIEGNTEKEFWYSDKEALNLNLATRIVDKYEISN